MNDFSDLEAKLKALRPVALREDLVARVEEAMAKPAVSEAAADKIVRPFQFRRQWLLGLSLAAAAAILLLVRVNFQTPNTSKRVAAVSPQPASSPAQTAPAALPNSFIPAGSTQVVYRQRDEGLLFAQNSDQPLRRVRSITQETLQWKNPATGASLKVSYPSEHIELVPMSPM